MDGLGKAPSYYFLEWHIKQAMMYLHEMASCLEHWLKSFSFAALYLTLLTSIWVAFPKYKQTEILPLVNCLILYESPVFCIPWFTENLPNFSVPHFLWICIFDRYNAISFRVGACFFIDCVKHYMEQPLEPPSVFDYNILLVIFYEEGKLTHW